MKTSSTVNITVIDFTTGCDFRHNIPSSVSQGTLKSRCMKIYKRIRFKGHGIYNFVFTDKVHVKTFSDGSPY